VIWRIIIPLSAPALASVALYTFMIAWNEFLFAFMFLDTPEKFTLSRGVVQLAGSVHLSKQLVMAASVMVTIPILLVFLFFERHLVRGLTAGAMKG
jgi:multiple sugar transport system permease protein